MTPECLLKKLSYRFCGNALCISNDNMKHALVYQIDKRFLDLIFLQLTLVVLVGRCPVSPQCLECKLLL